MIPSTYKKWSWLQNQEQNIEGAILGENMQPEDNYKIKDRVTSFDHHFLNISKSYFYWGLVPMIL